MQAVTEPKRRRSPKQTQTIPPALVYEQWNGKPIYYRGYRDVLAGKKTIEEIMSCSDLQGVLVALLTGHLFGILNRKKYLLASNEIGLHVALNDNLGSDLVIFDKEKVGKLKGKYFDVPPRVVIEVDIKADVADFQNKETEYILQKSQKMLDFGVEKVIWILTTPQKAYVIDRNDPRWYIVDWTENIPVLDDCLLNIQQLLTDEDITY
ncbi:hypothetical protein GCM10023189_23460 [Nibrella saemangeumensis]|uniref:Uma2 family endonuclease n=1 Tax=Nibrella saemangeumensis TaxID=1084526 RepID=A0ABP8MSX2_9BACT